MEKSRFPIAMQLAGMFTLVAALLLMILGYTLFQFKQAGLEAENIVNSTAPRLVLLKNGHTEFTRALLNMRGFLFYPDGMATYEKGYRDSIAKSLEMVQEYNRTSQEAEIKSDGEKLAKAISDYIEYADKRLIPARKANAPNWLAMTSEGRQMVVDTDAGYNKLAEVQQKVLDREGLAVLESSRRNSNLALTLSLVTIAIVIALVTWYSRNMAVRMNRVGTSLRQVGGLDLTGSDLVVTRNDELGDMGMVANEMRRSLREFVDQLGSSSEQLAASSHELSAAVDEQLRAVDQVAASINEIASGSTKNADSISNISATLEEVSAGSEQISAGAAEVNNSTQTAVREAAQGMDMLKRVVRQNEAISQTMGEINEVAEELAQGSEKIKGIVGVIDQIAGQTNLLALNAAIEAARAGEAGRGFAVVADEVRKLAEQSSQATQNIAEIIQAMGEQIHVAVSSVQKSSQEVNKGKESAILTQQGFESIIEKMEVVQNGTDQIARSISETAKGTQVMVASVENISVVAHQTSANSETVASSAQQQATGMREITLNAENLSSLAQNLQQIVERFKR
ncbi:methyl-accepting chemotaxis protein [Azotosporobacter soli]|uniref:methyl-accepting chemotaxis protein n=1 Tax=Azotosporobacter soli TaxID=3055040 RepID=UPI0031FF06C7